MPLENLDDLEASWSFWLTEKVNNKLTQGGVWRRDNPGEWSKLKAYYDGGPRPTLSSIVGKQMLEVVDAITEARGPVVEPPPVDPPDPTVHDVPTSITSDGTKNVAAELQAWIDSIPSESTLRLKAGGVYRVDSTINLTRSMVVFDGNGATIKTPGVGDGHLSILRVTNKNNVTIKNLKLTGGYTKPGVHDTSVQWCHGIEALGTANLLIEDVIVMDVGGDGVYLGLGTGRCVSTRISRLIADGTGRNGISFVAADNTTVVDGSCHRIGYIGLDAEPNAGAGFGVDGVICDGVTIGDYFMSAATVVGDADVFNVTFKNLRITATKGCRMQVGTPAGRRRKNIAFIGCMATQPSTTGSTYAIVATAVDGLTVTGNQLPTTGVLLSANSCTNITFSGNVPGTKSGF